MKHSWLAFIPILFMSGCNRLQTIPNPGQTPETWCTAHPCVPVDLGFVKFIVTEPSSSVLVYLLSFLAIAIGIYVIIKRENHKSRLWFGAALIFWGMAAFSAGTSYQAFSYEIKCAGREVCAWTSWWEVFYNMLQSFSMNSFLIAIGLCSMKDKLHSIVKVYAILNVVVFNAILFTGAFLPNKFMVSFEMMILFTGPNFLILFIINTKNYIKTKEPLELRLMILWLLQLVVMIVYYAYFLAGFKEVLWERGIWYTANDVLHTLLIFWMIYIFFFVVKKLKDTPT